MKMYILLLVMVLFMSCNTDQNKEVMDRDNPLLTVSTLPYNAPDFSKIKELHYLPAMKKAMQVQTQRIANIVDSKEQPTFENTILALEKSGKELDEVGNVFYAMASANTSEIIKQVQETLAPLTAAHTDNIFLNSILFGRVKAVYDQLPTLNIDAESKKLTEEYYKQFIQAGANLSEQKKEELKGINASLAKLQTQFNQTLLLANNETTIKVQDKEMLAGLSENEIEALKKDDGTYAITLLNTTQQPLLASLKNRALRERLFKASWNRTNGGKFNTNDLLLQIVKLRAQKAELLGFNNYAQWSLKNTMVGKSEVVENFFAKMIPDLAKKINAEATDIKAMMQQDSLTDLQPWDWAYYAEKVRKAKYDLDEKEIKPYFELKRVVEDGVFYAATELYGITFKERKDLPTYHPDVVVYDVLDADGSPLALFYGDYFARPSKRGGAWMSNFVTQSKLYNQRPVIYNVCNFQQPAEGKPALISYDDVRTLFHEFGHALHGIFADQKYPTLSGTAVARDFVEYPSQANEHWALEPKVLQHYAKHYQTKQPIPQVLIAKVKKASTFNQGFSLTEIMSAADIDLRWHQLTVPQVATIKDPSSFEKEVLTKDKLWNDYVPIRYRSSYFAHIFGGGYAAGYYAYLWTEMLADDTEAWFKENGGLKRSLGDRYRKMILSKGNTAPYAAMYKSFRGADPSPKYMIKARGLVQ